VPLGVKCNKIEIHSANIKAILDVNNFSIISGTGGAGKSIMLKHLFVDALKKKKQVPVFIELRDLNSNNCTVEELIFGTVKSFGLEMSSSLFNDAMGKGHFVLFLDGLDEVNKSIKNILLQEINKLTITFPNISILLTTRPDIKLSELDVFTVFKICPLTLENSVSLIKLLPADDEIKAKFVKDLPNGLFEKHESFLSNPLLLSIMLLTYGFSSDIPNKPSLFYNQAFEALFQRHDSFKGAYKRTRATELDIQEFAVVFSTFCILSYEDRKLNFTRTQVIEYIQKAKRITNIEFEVESYLEDLLQAVSLLVEDGMTINFTHRSFQEYFASKFIVESDDELKKELLKKYQNNAQSDSVYSLTRELNMNFVDFEVVLPFLNSLFAEIGYKKKIGISVYLKYIRILFYRFEFKGGNLYGTINNTEKKEMIYFILNNICRGFIEKEMTNNDKSKWISEKKLETKESEKIIIFQTRLLKTSDTFTKELYDNGMFFSKTSIRGLIKVFNDISERKEKLTISLSDLLNK